jgi:hypothetical protein
VSRRGRARHQARDDWSEYPGRRDAEQDHAPDAEQGTQPAPAAAAPGGPDDGLGGLSDGLGGVGDGLGGVGDGLGGVGGVGDGLGGVGDGLGGVGDGLGDRPGGPGGRLGRTGGLGGGRYPRPSDGSNGRDGLGVRLVDQAQPGRFRHGGRPLDGRARSGIIRY